MSSHQLKSKNKGTLLLFNCFVSSIATDDKDG